MRLNEPLCEYSDRWYPFLGRTITCHGPKMSLPSPNDARQSAWYLIDRCGTGAAWIAADQAETLRWSHLVGQLGGSVKVYSVA
jgi:hypothetical protein